MAPVLNRLTKQLAALNNLQSVALSYITFFHSESALPLRIIYLCTQIKLLSFRRKIQVLPKRNLWKHSYRGQLYSKCWHNACMYQVPCLGLL